MRASRPAGPGACAIPAHVGLVGLAWNVGQKLQGVQLNRGEAPVPQPPARGGTELEQVVQQCRGLGV